MQSEPLAAPWCSGIVTQNVTRPQASQVRVSPRGFGGPWSGDGMGRTGGWLTAPLYQRAAIPGRGLTAH